MTAFTHLGSVRWRRSGARGLTIALLVVITGCGDEPASDDGTATQATDAADTGVTTPYVVPEPEPLPPELELVFGLIRQRQFATARLRAQRYLETHPDDGRAVFLIGLSHHRARAYALAQPFFERALELKPDEHPVHHFLGYCRFHQGDLAGAREAFEAHLRWLPQESDSHFGLGLIDLEEGQHDAAEGRFRHAMALIRDLEHTDPARYAVRKVDLGKCQARLGDVAFARGAYAEAADLFRAAIEADPAQYTAYYGLSQALRRLGENDEADRMLAEYERLSAPRTGRAGASE